MSMKGLWMSLLITLLTTALVRNEGSAQLADQKELFISLEGTPSLGDVNAPVAIVEFADYQCPYCIAYANNMLPQIIADYVSTGKVRYFFKDLPIENLHPDALKAAEAAHCAGEQSKYWEMHARLFKSADALALSRLPSYARMLGLNVAEFEECLRNGKHAVHIRMDIEDSKKFGVEGTPTFFIGPLDVQHSRMKIATKIQGTQDYVVFQQALGAIGLVPAAGGDARN
jgi:protein-disulfide isomerase